MAEKSGWMEKRQHERFLTALKVSYRIISTAEAQTILSQDSYRETTADRLPMISQVSPLYEAVTQDISLGGFCMVSEQAVPARTVVEVILTLTQTMTALKFMAEVVRTEPLSQGGSTLHRLGLKTLAIHKEDMTRMEQYLADKMGNP